MKRPNSFVQRGSDTDMNSTMTPMIDVVFLLLVFFVWTASFVITEQILKSELSQEAGSDPVEQVDPLPEQDFENIVVRIGYDGNSPTWQINDTTVASLAEVKASLLNVSNVKPDAPVILRPESLVPLGYVIDAYDTVKVSGFQKVSFAVNMKLD